MKFLTSNKIVLFLAVLFLFPPVLADSFNNVITNDLNVTQNASIGSGNITIIMNGTTGNINTSGNVTASYFKGDGSLLTGISGFTFSDYFNQNVNTTANVTFNRVGLGTTIPTYPLHFKGSLSGTPVGYFLINATSGVSSALNFFMDIPSTSSATGTIGAIGFYNKISEKKDRSGTSLIEGMRNEIGVDSVVQTGGITDIKGINTVLTLKQNTGGTQTVYGTYTSFPAPLILSGSPTYNFYGHYVSGAQTTYDGASGTVNRYGIYLTGFTKGTFDDVVYALYADGPIRGGDYYSGDGTQGMTGTCTIASITTITVKDGLITACS